MATVHLSFNVPAAHIARLRAYLDFRYGDTLSGMTDTQAFEHHVVQSTVPGYKLWRRAYDVPVATAKAAIETNNAARAAALSVDAAALAGAQSDADASGDGAITGMS